VQNQPSPLVVWQRAALRRDAGRFITLRGALGQLKPNQRHQTLVCLPFSFEDCVSVRASGCMQLRRALWMRVEELSVARWRRGLFLYASARGRAVGIQEKDAR
jgi:hypothetical protein